MPRAQDRKRSEKAQLTTATQKQLFNNRDQAKQTLKSVHQGREMENQTTKEGRAIRAAAQALIKKREAAEREAAAMREAIRQDMELQKTLIERYGYGQYRLASACDETQEIELSFLGELESNETVSEESQQGQLNATTKQGRSEGKGGPVFSSP
ncbi:hypothetical protein G7Y79_00001g000770 [Physcia stellaris]|nr:hypothetical protein G7Y79_00001g000770 [Physcia stellaris]